MSGIASSEGEEVRASRSAASTTAATSSGPAISWLTVPAAVPPSTSANAVTIKVRPCISPLVVRALLAQRRLASVRSVMLATPGIVARSRACSTRSWTRRSPEA